MSAISISIIVPVFNEAKTVRDLLELLLKVASENCWDVEILVVNDGSSDGTSEQLAGFGLHSRVRIFTHPVNRGKGAAIRTALQNATKDLTVIQDADLEYDPQQIADLISAIRDSGVDAAYGSRVLGARMNLSKQRHNIYALGVVALNVVTRCLFGLRLTDEATCYKLFRTNDLLRMQLNCQRFEFCPEVTAKAARLGLSIVEVPISYNPRSVKEGKKIGLWDAFSAFQTLWRYRNWVPQERAIQVESHDQ